MPFGSFGRRRAVRENIAAEGEVLRRAYPLPTEGGERLQELLALLPNDEGDERMRQIVSQMRDIEARPVGAKRRKAPPRPRPKPAT